MSIAARSPERLATERRISKKRRRPSGEPPPLPRSLRSGKYWIAMMIAGALSWIGLGLVTAAGPSLTRFDVGILSGIAELRTPWLTRVMRSVDALGSEWVVLVLRWAVIAGALFFKRLRHLFVFIGSILLGGAIAAVAAQSISRPRPLDIDIIGHWQGASHPSRPIGALAITLVGILYVMVVPGRPRTIGKWIVGAIVGAVSIAHVYLAVDHPTDVVAGIILGVTIPLVAFRLLTPNDSFPVSYKKRRAAHLDVDGPRGEAIQRAIEEQLGITLVDLEPFGLGGSAGSTPLRLRVAGEPPVELFGKLYAQTHLRSDRWYKLGRTLLYGRLEDEGTFSTVRRLVQYEDYILRVMRDAGLPTPKPYGFVEITPEGEYLLVTSFVHGAKELLDADITDEVIDESLLLVRNLWDAGLAHRDIKPSNILVTHRGVHLIDVAFGEVRPTPWREAVDLANMMLALALRRDAATVYRAALNHFTPNDIAEAFAATHGMTMPSQTRRLMKESGKDLVAEFRALAPQRPPISIQTWSLRRIGLSLGVLLAGLIALAISFSNFRGAGLSPPQDATTSAYSAVGEEPQCRASNAMILEAQSVPSARLLPCIEALPAGWSFSGLDVIDGRSRIFLDSDRAGFRAVNVTLSASCNVAGASEVQTDEPGTRRYERVFPREDLFSGERYYVFDGGCATYEFELTGEGRAGLTAEAAVAMSFLSREALEEELFEETGLRL
jgi:tRNA A-37 threonylcarbamoyl transferase component Bud32/membrane-associated phospholipid phosphatase